MRFGRFQSIVDVCRALEMQQNVPRRNVKSRDKPSNAAACLIDMALHLKQHS